MMKVDGRCHCGDIAFEAEIDPERVTICHCSDCQRLSGSAYRVNVYADAAKFRFTRGEPAFYERTAESGRQRRHAFCPRCGAEFYSTGTAGEPARALSLRTGTIAQRGELKPARQIWCRSAMGWTQDLDGIPQHETGG